MILTKCDCGTVSFDDKINEKLLGGRINELLLVVPTNRKSRHIKKGLISSSPGKTSGALNIDTVGTFATKMVFSNSFTNKLLSDSAAKVLLKQAFKECKLRYFSQYHSDIPDGTLDRVKNVISEYKRHGISPDMLLYEAEKLVTSEKLKAEDIAIVYKAYNRLCGALGLKEIGDIYYDVNSLKAEDFNGRFKELYKDVSLVLIDGFDEFTNPETNIISSAADIPGLELYLRFDYYDYNYLIFSHLTASYENFLAKGFVKKTDATFIPAGEFRSIIQKSLFLTNVKKKNEKFKNVVSVIKAWDRQKEVELISKEIKHLIKEKGVKPHRICAVFNLIPNYSSIIRDIFTLNGIPFNLTDRFSLRTFIAATSVISFLEILENDFYYKNVFRALGGILFDDDEIDSANLQKTAVKLKLVSGYENYTSKIRDTKKLLQRLDEGSGSGLQKLNLDKALADLVRIKKTLEPFNKDMAPKAFFENVKTLIYERRLPIKIINGNNLHQEENIKAVESFIDTIEELTELFILENGETQKFPLGFYLNNLRTAVKSARFNINEKSKYGVLVTNLNEIRGLNFDYLFIGGLTDGDLPTRYNPEIFFSGSFAKNSERHITEERYLFYQSLSSWQKGLYLSYSETEKGKELARSNFLNEFEQLFEVTEITSEKYDGFVYNKEEALRIAGDDSFKNKAELLAANNIDQVKIKRDTEFYCRRILNPFEVFEGNGFIYNGLDAGAKEKLAERADVNYSITQLEIYARCPFRYFVERVLSLNEVEEPKEEIEAVELGSLLHDILFEYSVKIKKEGIDVVSCNYEEFNKAVKLLMEIAELKIEETGFHSPFAFYEKEKILGMQGNREESVLYNFLQTEKTRNADFTPEYFEVPFGKSGFNKSELSYLRVNNVNVAGKIDRVDVDEKNKRYKIADYKLSGKKPTAQELALGISLQLPLYMYAAKELLNEKSGEGFEPASADIYSLKQGKDFGRNTISKAGRAEYDDAAEEKRKELIEGNNRMIENCKEKIQEYVKAMSEGRFNLSDLENREKEACMYCNYAPICRVKEIFGE